MKKCTNLLLSLLWIVSVVVGVASAVHAQTTNTFPATGNVGIGTMNPNASLQVVGPAVASAFNGFNTVDNFTDSSNTMSHYGLTWADFSNGTIGPSAMLSGYGGINLYTSGTRRMTITPFGSVGIGTTSPQEILDVTGFPAFGSSNTDKLSLGGGSIGFNRRVATGYIYNSSIYAYQFQHTGSSTPGSDFLAFQVYRTDGSQVTPSAWSVNGYGNVGIGTTSPGEKLEVSGNIKFAGSLKFPDGSTQSTAWTGSLCGGDYAESIDVSDDRRKYEPGDVLVIDPNVEGKFLKSSEPYSISVAGVYSTKPGVVGRRQTAAKNPDEIPMAVVGIVPTKVSTENGAIHPGDVLVTSSTPGYAMKGTDRSLLTGAIVGKAMGSLVSGNGVIEVLVSLQ